MQIVLDILALFSRISHFILLRIAAILASHAHPGQNTQGAKSGWCASEKRVPELDHGLILCHPPCRIPSHLCLPFPRLWNAFRFVSSGCDHIVLWGTGLALLFFCLPMATVCSRLNLKEKRLPTFSCNVILYPSALFCISRLSFVPGCLFHPLGSSLGFFIDYQHASTFFFLLWSKSTDINIKWPCLSYIIFLFEILHCYDFKSILLMFICFKYLYLSLYFTLLASSF